MTDKPEVVCWGSFYKGVIQDFGYNEKATTDNARLDFHGRELTIEPLIRLTDHEAARAADRARIEALEDFAREIIKQYPNPDISHLDFRVHTCRNAEAVMQQDQPEVTAQPDPCKGNCQTWIGNRTTGQIQCADCGRPRP